MCATLKRLTFFHDEDPKSVLFDTPNLEYLEYFHSLVEAHIGGLRMTDDQSADAAYPEEDGYLEKEMVGNATDFLMGLCNVRILYLSATALEVCIDFNPIFFHILVSVSVILRL